VIMMPWRLSKPMEQPAPRSLPRQNVALTAEQMRAIAILKRLKGIYQEDKPGVVVEVVFLPGAKVNDILKELLPLSEIERLVLQGTDISDADMKYVAGFKKLQKLWLDATAITDVGVKELMNCEHLTYLGLGNTRVTDAGVKSLKVLKSLQKLDARDTAITYAGVKELKQELPNLTVALARSDELDVAMEGEFDAQGQGEFPWRLAAAGGCIALVVVFAAGICILRRRHRIPCGTTRTGAHVQ
jgi:hypothetical protein